MHCNFPSSISQRTLQPSSPPPFPFKCHYCFMYQCWIRNKSTGEVTLTTAAPCQNNAVSIRRSICGKSLILLIDAYIAHCQSIFRVHRTPLASDLASVKDGIDFTKTNPVNEDCGIDPPVIACCDKEFSGNTSYLNLASCSQASSPLPSWFRCYINVWGLYWLRHLPVRKPPKERQTCAFFKYVKNSSDSLYLKGNVIKQMNHFLPWSITPFAIYVLSPFHWFWLRQF